MWAFDTDEPTLAEGLWFVSVCLKSQLLVNSPKCLKELLCF